ncbi:hypothetical protein BpHYR1_052803 [Brachionus plicatilis]|uniref:Uncharacterized protein n=1 Tax=Brachionus plicatilis TaxID=10195 RepID=A0A3M7RE23_BRAPC|nr:hypothetical protein BpHYR1_052803 [Brachionus plicatilis]
MVKTKFLPFEIVSISLWNQNNSSWVRVRGENKKINTTDIAFFISNSKKWFIIFNIDLWKVQKDLKPSFKPSFIRCLLF